MPHLQDSGFCCGLVELGEFSSLSTKENILQELRKYYQNILHYDGDEAPFAIFATTSVDQTTAEKALKELKFKATKFKSRYEKGTRKILTHWFRATPPRELSAFIRKLKKEANDNRGY